MKNVKPSPLRVEPYGKNIWRFVQDANSIPEDDYMELGAEMINNGHFEGALMLFEKMERIYPNNLLLFHYIAIVHMKGGDHRKARKYWEAAVESGRAAIPPEFVRGKDTMPWIVSENRPFLLCMHGLAVHLLDRRKEKDAIPIMEEMLDYNPDDNQGMREPLVCMYLKMGENDKALELAKKFDDDALAGILWGRPLALLRLGRKAEAARKLEEAIKFQPRVAAELLKTKHRKPPGMKDAYVEYGGWDEAYQYWKLYGNLWKTGDLAALREAADRVGLDTRLRVLAGANGR